VFHLFYALPHRGQMKDHYEHQSIKVDLPIHEGKYFGLLPEVVKIP
jgi:hypothetical protein